MLLSINCTINDLVVTIHVIFVKSCVIFTFFYFSAEMINKLTLTFNRTRQAVITRELIEIISGASALE